VDPTSSFESILSDPAETPTPHEHADPPYFADLHLDDIVTAVMAGHAASTFARVFHSPLRDVAAITYRHDVFRDLEDTVLLEAVQSFGNQMATVQRWLVHASKATYAADQERWLVSGADAFGAAVAELNDRLQPLQPKSAGLSRFRGYLASYVASEAFTTLVADTQRVKAAIDGLRYRLRIHGAKVTVTCFRDEPDFSAEVLQTFAKFPQAGTGKRYEWRFDQDSDMDHVEAAILERVARLHPETFSAMHAYAERHRTFLDPIISRFDSEIRFYIAWLDFTERIRRGSGLAFCYPEVSQESRDVEACGIFDLALAASLLHDGAGMVPNDLELHGGERIMLVSGPNQGGKTTFARAIGQLHHLARIGVPVPGTRVRLPLVDAIYTHFERRERVEDLSSKLEGDLRRIHAMLEQATSESLLVMNESFTSTTVGDQLFIGRRMLRQILDLGLTCVIVTFLDELASFDLAIVSMMAGVDPNDFARRTFEIVRRPPDGLAYALAIAEKHRLTYPRLKARMTR
jgi:DNA mismatch repair protein MutS